MTEAPPRYFVVEGSHSAHCCFEVSILDRTKPSSLNTAGHPEYSEDYWAVCECFEKDDADKIAAALNALEGIT